MALAEALEVRRGHKTEGPSLPQVVFRVAVTGHRPNRLEPDTSALRERLQEVLQTIAAAVERYGPAQGRPKLRIVSSLAEGVDRLAAHCALELGYTLQAPLPLPRAEYEEDFAGAVSLAEFRELLARAEAVFELEGAPPHRDFAYRAAGHIALQQCDVLLAVWDGEPSRGVGGTSELIDLAEEIHRPVMYVGAAAPYALSFMDQPDALHAIGEFVRERLARPEDSTRSYESTYRAECWPKRVATTSYTLLRLLGERRWLLARSPKQTAAVTEIQTPMLQPYFRWMDALAIYYGERSRSAAMRMQLLALLAVTAAILILPFEDRRGMIQLLSLTEVGAIVWLLIEARRSSRNDWHTRWLLYRSLAERLRCLDFLWPLAGAVPAPQTGGFADGRRASEVAFGVDFLEGVVRELGLANASADAAFRARQSDALCAVVRDQAAFQRRVAHRYEAVETLLHWAGLSLFVGAVVLCLLDVLHALGPELFERLHGMGLSGVHIATAAAILPALGAALAGLAAQGEYKRLAMRSDAMSQSLLDLLEDFETRTTHSLRDLQSFSQQVSDVLTSEVQDWQVLVSAKPPALPT